VKISTTTSRWLSRMINPYISSSWKMFFINLHSLHYLYQVNTYNLITTLYTYTCLIDHAVKYMYSKIAWLKKRCSPVQNGQCQKKLWNQRGQPRNVCDDIGWWQKFQFTTASHFQQGRTFFTTRLFLSIDITTFCNLIFIFYRF